MASHPPLVVRTTQLAPRIETFGPVVNRERFPLQFLCYPLKFPCKAGKIPLLVGVAELCTSYWNSVLF
jgi:hypothetical protein